MNEMHHSRILGMVGERGSGKTSLILDLLREFQKEGLKIGGVISPGIFEGHRKIAIEMINLFTGEGRLLAVLREEKETDLQFGDWSFFVETLDWANQSLQTLPDCDLLILDEIGPLELEFGKGLQKGLTQMTEGQQSLGLMTLRPRCVEAALRFFPRIELFYLKSNKPESIKRAIFRVVVNN